MDEVTTDGRRARAWWRGRAVITDVGVLVVAADLAVAQPVLDLLARHPEFFVARRAPTAEVVSLALVLAVALPLLLAVAVVGLRRALPRLGGALHTGLLAALGAVLTAQLLGDVAGEAAVVALAVAGGALLARGHRRVAAMGTAVRWGLPVVPLLVVGAFLLSAPIGASATADARVDAEIRNPAPVVVVVLDELPTTSLLGADGRIDAARFPGFARLAATSTWFPDAATPYDHTHRIVPALLTGQPWRKGRAPVAADHPRNLFTLLGDDYDVVARERVTWLCPPPLCPVPGDRLGARMADLSRDVGVVTAHVVLPEPLSGGLPPIDHAWGGFGDEGDGAVAAPPGAGDLSFEAFLASFEADADRPLLRYYHLMAPHHPFRTLPDGSSYPETLPMPAYDDGPPDAADEFYIAQAQQRHLLQVGAVDRQVGRLLDALEAWPDYDDALVVVLGDHGVSFRAGQSLRLTRAGNVDDIAYVPLFVKAPGQRRARIDERPALVTDLLATVDDVLDVRGGPAPQGTSLLAEAPDPDRRRALLSLLGTSHPLPSDGSGRARALARQTRRFGTGGDWDAVWRRGAHPDLLGQAVQDVGVGDPDAGAVELTDLPSVTPVGAPRAEGPSRPVLVDGRVVGADVPAGTWLAVAVHGRVAALAPVHDREAGPDRFTAMVPPQAYAEGVAPPDLYRVGASADGAVVLHPLEVRDVDGT